MVKGKKENKQRKLPLVEFLNEKNNIDLLDDSNQFELPSYISENLRHTLRPYQINAINNLNWTQRSEHANLKYKEILFNMATGSGKTDIMAALILYMYAEFNYHNFMFVVNTNSVLTKTIDNLLNTSSSKYLFKSPININNQDIQIHRVDNFSNNLDDTVINIKLTTIQSLANEINHPKENGLTLESIQDNKIVVLADEAHHFNVLTNSGKKLSESDIDNISWEKVLLDILNTNPENRQFDFTATIDFQVDSIYKKYKDITVYKYSLSDFIKDQYAKKVNRIQANSDDYSRMLNSVLLSQYRKKFAESLGIPNFKPIIMFKATTISSSKSANELFEKIINNLTKDSLLEFIKKQKTISSSNALKLCYEYFLQQEEIGNLYSLLIEIKNDFKSLNIINANSSSSDGILGDNNYLNLNTIDNVNNPFRVVFAVAKLTEGWDVLNLYDIVRIGNDKTSTKNLQAEAQLVGRGARYYPFEYKDRISYQRRFDNIDSKFGLLLETIHYHTLSESKYIEKLNEEFDKMNLPVDDDSGYQIFHANVKKGFKRSSIYRKGKLYFNEVKNVPDYCYDNLSKYMIPTSYDANMMEGSYESYYNEDVDIDKNSRLIFVFKLSSAERIVKKAMAKNKFFRFNILKKYIPILNTLEEFINDDKWLGGVTINAKVDYGIEELTIQQKLNVVSEFLTIVKNNIIKNFHRKIGTNKFISKPMNEIINDYSKRVPIQSNNIGFRERINEYPMDDRKWFVYDNAVVDGLEKDLIDLIGSYVDRLEEKYNDVYLIRNEETKNGIKLHQFNDQNYHFQGYMPDFILYLNDEKICYQIYVEAKGKHLLTTDRWKEVLLKNIKPDNIDVIGENDHVKLYGVSFYTSKDITALGKTNFQNDIEKFI